MDSKNVRCTRAGEYLFAAEAPSSDLSNARMVPGMYRAGRNICRCASLHLERILRRNRCSDLLCTEGETVFGTPLVRVLAGLTRISFNFSRCERTYPPTTIQKPFYTVFAGLFQVATIIDETRKRIQWWETYGQPLDCVQKKKPVIL